MSFRTIFTGIGAFACGAIVVMAADRPAEKKITFTGCVVRDRDCLLVQTADGKVKYGLSRDLNGKLEPGKAYTISGVHSAATPCLEVSGTIEPRKSTPAPVACAETASAPNGNAPASAGLR